jgi:hypothetical protein
MINELVFFIFLFLSRSQRLARTRLRRGGSGDSILSLTPSFRCLGANDYIKVVRKKMKNTMNI